jgi:hypothetical protein
VSLTIEPGPQRGDQAVDDDRAGRRASRSRPRHRSSPRW